MPVPSQESDRSCICVLEESSLPLSTNFILEFRTVSIRQFRILFYFSFCIVIHTSSEWFVAENNVSSRYF